MPAKIRPAAVPATFVSVAAILALAVAASSSSAAVRPPSEQLSCGDTITADTTLHHNLVNCPNNGIVIGADNVTLDLNYHTIDGDNTEFPACHPNENCDFGVLNDGHDGVTVVNGSIHQFEAGSVLFDGHHNRVLGISSSRNRFAGIAFINARRSLVRNSSGDGSRTHEGGTGMLIVASHHVRILHSSFRNNGDRGIGVFHSTHNLIKGNRLSRNRGAGIVLGHGASRNHLRRNRSVRGGDGIDIEGGNRNVITRNRVSHPRGFDGIGISLDAGDHNVIARNSIRDASGNAITVGFGRAIDNVARRNHIRGAGEDGLRVFVKAKHSFLGHNVALGAKDDGLDINNPKTKLTKNRARRNSDLGIEAVRGVIDGGGNKASANGDPRQCTNVTCH